MFGRITMLLLLAGGMILPVTAQDEQPPADVDSELVTQTPVPRRLTATTDLFVTTQIRMNVRSGPDTDYDVVGLMVFGDSLDVTGQNDDGSWLRVDFRGIEGWVFRNLVSVTGSLDDAPVVQPGELTPLAEDAEAATPTLDGSVNQPYTSIVVVKTAYNSNMRRSPTVEGAVLDVIPFNQELNPVGRTTDSAWVVVIYGGRSGWLYAPLLMFTSGNVRSLPVMTALPVVTPTLTATIEAEGEE